MDSVRDRGGAEDGTDRGEHFFLGDTHGGCDVHDESGLEVMTFGMLGMVITLPAHEEFRALGNSFGDEGFEAGKGICGDHGTDVDIGVCKGRAKAECLDAGFEERD